MARYEDAYGTWYSPISPRTQVFQIILIAAFAVPVAATSGMVLQIAPDIWGPKAAIPSTLAAVLFMAIISYSFGSKKLLVHRRPLHAIAWLGFLCIVAGIACSGYSLFTYKVRRPELQPPPGTKCRRNACYLEKEQTLLGLSFGFHLAQW
ncbi:hypothetical protein FQN55_001141 [Onygenales sp. PD_40]|nr:hypothetical protein FQN55_001141 [Onygenales sp. PD_40]KAK2792011.1 hypothetical protein FQN52_004117 [Onygenales sp. PD_12]